MTPPMAKVGIVILRSRLPRTPRYGRSGRRGGPSNSGRIGPVTPVVLMAVLTLCGAAASAAPPVPASTAAGSAPSVPTAPTQAQLDAVANASDPGTAAAALAQSLSDQAVTETQANINASVQSLPDYTTTLAPFCGEGSTQWIAGLDNCTLLEFAAVALGVLLLLGFVNNRGRR